MGVNCARLDSAAREDALKRTSYGDAEYKVIREALGSSTPLIPNLCTLVVAYIPRREWREWSLVSRDDKHNRGIVGRMVQTEFLLPVLNALDYTGEGLSEWRTEEQLSGISALHFTLKMSVGLAFDAVLPSVLKQFEAARLVKSRVMVE